MFMMILKPVGIQGRLINLKSSLQLRELLGTYSYAMGTGQKHDYTRELLWSYL